jgi:hypothetical protein
MSLLIGTSMDKWQICNGKNYDERQTTMKYSLETPVTHHNIDFYFAILSFALDLSPLAGAVTSAGTRQFIHYKSHHRLVKREPDTVGFARSTN